MWLGYPGTSGASYMDYIVTDKVTSPLHLAEQYSEKLAYMPHSFFVGDHRYMFPHLLFKGLGTTNPDAIRSIDSQSGVIQVKGEIQKPVHPISNQLSQQQSQLQQLVLHQQQASLLQAQAQGHSLFGLQQQQASHFFASSQLATLQQIQQLQSQQQSQHHSSPIQLSHQGYLPSQLTQVGQDTYSLPTDLPLTTRAQYGLPENTIVFCNFNQLYKIDPSTMETWVNVLKRVPNSILWLLRFPATGETNILNMATTFGLPQSRIIFSPVAPKEEHVRRGRVADLCLDTPLCNGHTTGMDVLWAGTPVLTLPLESLASRVAASQLYALGFPELVATSRADYEEIAVRLGNNPQE